VAILPGATIGILGGGQLGRMTAMAARSLGYDVAVLDPDPGCAAGIFASRRVTAPFDDSSAAAELARGSAVVTYEIEKIALAAVEAAAAGGEREDLAIFPPSKPDRRVSPPPAFRVTASLPCARQTETKNRPGQNLCPGWLAGTAVSPTFSAA